ncbi:MAG: copper ion binding protein [Clostridia bacterium]|nr:copper ion binding protein [Clostridia bacterium]
MKKQIFIEGMTCGHCSGRVEKALKALDGVVDAKVDLANKNALVEMNGSIEDSVFIETIDDAGYDVIEIKNI